MVGGLIAYLIYITTKAPKRWMGGLISVGIFPNISDLPIAYLQTFAKGGVILTSAQGEKGVAYVCIYLMVMVMYQFSLGLFRLIEYDFRDELLDKTDEEEKICTDSEGSERHPDVSNASAASSEKKASLMILLTNVCVNKTIVTPILTTNLMMMMMMLMTSKRMKIHQ